MTDLRQYTAARVSLGRAGNSVTTREVLDFALAHARARDAVHFPLDLEIEGAIYLESAARDRAEYLRRPDLGRRLSDMSRAKLMSPTRDPMLPTPDPVSPSRDRKGVGSFDVVFAVIDGLSALAVHNHAQAVLNELKPLLDETWKIAPLMIVRQGRVAIGDEIGSAIKAALAVVLIGERPGLTSPDSLGIYLTWDPRSGRTDAERNCISNIHSGGLSPGAAARLLAALMRDSRAREISGISLKAPALNSLPETP